MNTLVYSYGCKRPVGGLDEIDQQISLAHKYYNVLVALHRDKRDAVNRVRCELCPELECAEAGASAAEEAVDAAVAEMRKRNAAARRKRATPSENHDLAALKELRSVCWADLKAVREHVKQDAAINAALEAVTVEFDGVKLLGSDRRKGGKFKDARERCGVYWGTYLEIEKALNLAIETTQGRPHFRRWTGDGLVAVQIQLGMTVDELAANDDTRLRLGPEQPRGKSCPIRMLSLRVGSAGREPVFATVPVYMHRPLPADARIMGCSLVRRKVAVRRTSAGEWRDYYEWSVKLTIRTHRQKPAAFDGACGIDLGWRMLDTGLRVAYLAGSDGTRLSFELPNELLDRWSRCDSLQSTRDQMFNAVIDELADRFFPLLTLPEAVQQAAQHMRLWQAKGKLATLLRVWSENRFDGDGEAFDKLQRWQEQDAHLWQWQRANMIKAEAIRKDLYRKFAAMMRMTYGTVLVEDCDWRELAKRPEVTDNQPVNATARVLQRIAAVGMLRTELVANGASKSDSKHTTTTCHLCGHVNTAWTDKVQLEQTCAGCLATWDQDENAAMNLLARAEAIAAERAAKAAQVTDTASDSANGTNGSARVPQAADGNMDAPTASKYVGRWQRLKADRSQREAQGVGGS